jgi:hypothetical protein
MHHKGDERMRPVTNSEILYFNKWEKIFDKKAYSVEGHK